MNTVIFIDSINPLDLSVFVINFLFSFLPAGKEGALVTLSSQSFAAI